MVRVAQRFQRGAVLVGAVCAAFVLCVGLVMATASSALADTSDTDWENYLSLIADESVLEQYNHGSIAVTCDDASSSNVIELAVGETVTIVVSPYQHVQYKGCRMFTGSGTCPTICSEYKDGCFVQGYGCSCDKTATLVTATVDISSTDESVLSVSEDLALSRTLTATSSLRGETNTATITITAEAVGTTELTVSVDGLYFWYANTTTYTVIVTEATADTDDEDADDVDGSDTDADEDDDDDDDVDDGVDDSQDADSEDDGSEDEGQEDDAEADDDVSEGNGEADGGSADNDGESDNGGSDGDADADDDADSDGDVDADDDSCESESDDSGESHTESDDDSCDDESAGDSEAEEHEIAYDYFDDVTDASKYWYEAVYAVADAGYMTGKSSTHFGASDPLTRAQMVTIIWRIACPEEYASYVQSEAVNETDLPDVEDGKYYTAAVNWAVSEGIITGKKAADGTYYFAPNDECTFQQFCTILARYLAGSDEALDASMTDAEVDEVLASFSDASSISDYAQKAVAYCVKHGAVDGKANGTVAPKETVARYRCVTVIYKAMNAGLL